MKRPFAFFRALAAPLLPGFALLAPCVGLLACRMDGGEDFARPGLQVQSVAPPVLQSFSVDSADSMLLCFDKDVSVCDASLSLSGGGGEAVAVTGRQDGGAGCCRLDFARSTRIGSVYDLNAVARDNDGNSLSFTLTFDAFNDRIPDLLLCEVRNAYSSKSSKYEFVRLYCAKAGNLSGLELLSAGDGEGKAFAFPPIEVAEGEYVCVHLRKMKDEGGLWMQEGMVDESGGDRTASTAVDSSADAWDFWQDNQKSRLSPSDIVILRTRTGGRVLDALLFRDPKKDADSWDGKFDRYCRAVAQSGCWLDGRGQSSADYGSAFVAEGITSSAVTRTMKRRSLEFRPSSAADWCVEQSK